MVNKDYRSVCVMYRVSKVNVLAWVNGLNCLQSHPRRKSWGQGYKIFLQPSSNTWNKFCFQ